MIALDERRRRAAARARGPARRAERGQRAHPRGRRRGRARARDRGDARRLPRARRSSSASSPRSSSSCRARSRRCPTCPIPTAADGPEDELVREVGAPRELDFEPRDHLELAGEAIDMERAARLSGSRFAYLKGELVMLELALVRWALEKLRGQGFEPVIPPVLVRERALFGTGFLPDTEQQIYSAASGRAVPGRHLRGGARLAARRRDPRGRAPAAALRGLLAVLPARGGRRGQGHARDLPRAPVRQGRDVQLRRAGGLRAGARADPRDRGGDPRRAGAALPRASTSRSANSATRPPRSTTARRGCPARAATAS